MLSVTDTRLAHTCEGFARRDFLRTKPAGQNWAVPFEASPSYSYS